MKMSFVARRELAPYVWEYSFKPEGRLDFIPGQYADFHLAYDAPDPRGHTRVFTMTSLPSDEHISFVVKFPSPCSPYKQALQTLQSGDVVRVDEPMGDLVLPKMVSAPLVFIAGGIGIASFVSMLTQLTQQKEERQIFLFYALRSRTEQIFTELFNSYPLALKQLVYAPNRLSAEEILDSTPPDALAYLSGSQKFVEGLQTDLESLGKPRSDIVFDYYEGYTEL